MARQRLGQHFLREGWPEQIARAIGLARRSPERSSESGFCWIEIGAGHGEMTEQLAATGTPVYAVEIDPPLVERLRQLTEHFPNLMVLPGDVLRVDLHGLADGRRIKLYGNLPYYITSPILHRIFQSAKLIDEIHVVIQAEVAFRLVAQPGTRDYGYLSVLTQFFSRPEINLKLPPSAFQPPPEVASALVSMKLHRESAKCDVTDEAAFFEFVKACFAQKRKTLANNLRTTVKRERTQEALEEIGVGPSARAEELSVGQLGALFRKLRPSGA